MITAAKTAADPGQRIPRLVADCDCLSVANGGLRLRGPLLVRRGPHRWIAWLFASPPRIEVELDDIGAFVVARMDGRRLHHIADDLATHLKLSRREAEVALAQFINGLVVRRLVQVGYGTETTA